MVHVADVTCTLGVAMVLLNDLIHKWSKGCVRVMRASIDTDARVDILASRQDGSSEAETTAIETVFKLIPDVSRQVLAEKGGCSLGEGREAS